MDKVSELATKCYNEIMEREERVSAPRFPKKTSIFERAEESKMAEQHKSILFTKEAEGLGLDLTPKANQTAMTKEQFKEKYQELLTKSADMVQVAEEVKQEEAEKSEKAMENLTPVERRIFARKNSNPLADGELAVTAIMPVMMLKMMMLSAEYLGMSLQELQMLNMKKD